MTTGEKIREARKKYGLTQKALGEKAGIAEPTIRRYELGKLNPKIGTIQKIAAALGVEWQTLLEDSPVYSILEGTNADDKKIIQELRRRAKDGDSMSESALDTIYGLIGRIDHLESEIVRYEERMASYKKTFDTLSAIALNAVNANTAQTGADAAGGEEAEGCQK